MSRYKTSGYQRYTYDPQTQVDKCLECRRTQAECNVCSANPKAEHKFNKDERIIELWQQGLYDVEIAKILGVSTQKVGRIRAKHDLPVNHHQKHKKIDTKKLVELWGSGKKDVEIAEMLDCCPETVRKARAKIGLPPQCRRSKNET